MKYMAWSKWALSVTVCGLAFLVGAANAGRAQESPAKAAPTQPKTAEQQFKNIQVLKATAADQLIPSMQFIAASLGVDCEFCHVEQAMDKDDKKAKQTARKMITMMMAINRGQFDGQREVTCYTCHRGTPHPAATPILSAEPPKMAAHEHEHEHEHGDEGEAHEVLPTADQVLDKYLSAVGGADALAKIKTRVQKGKIDAFGAQYPIEIYSQAPEKRVSITHLPSGASVTAFNGEIGWLSMPGGFHRMTAAEGEAARIDAELHFAALLRQLYKEFHVRPGEEIAGRSTYLVTSVAPGKPSLRLYFDQQNGLLLRLIRYAETPLGLNPTEIDYVDYRETDGVKIPYQWTLIRPNGSFTIHIGQVQQNVPVDEKLFVAPSDPPGQ